jgi:Phosphoesterase family
VRTVLEALMGNQALWETTALFITYDEHDGYFDHVLPGSPETTVTNEFIGGLPIGFGPRVPMIICSPWTRGGFVDSNSYDHTSMLRFLETWTGVQAPNITAWRRSVTGDLTAAFDFTGPDFSIPTLPDLHPRGQRLCRHYPDRNGGRERLGERHLARRLQRLLRRDHHREHERRLHPPLRGPHRVRKEHGQKQSG